MVVLLLDRWGWSDADERTLVVRVGCGEGRRLVDLDVDTRRVRRVAWGWLGSDLRWERWRCPRPGATR
jgi:hypothetical protein